MVHAVYESPVLRATCPVIFITAVDDDARKPQPDNSISSAAAWGLGL